MNRIDSFTGDFEVLSNFSRLLVPFSIRRERFFYVEVAYQALKATRHAEFLKIAHTNDPRKAKRLGRKVDLNQRYWDLVSPGIMYSLLQMKFWSNPTMERVLLSTGKMKLIEGNTWHDNKWGDCSCQNASGEHLVCLYLGRNLLGRLLMQVRKELKNNG